MEYRIQCFVFYCWLWSSECWTSEEDVHASMVFIGALHLFFTMNLWNAFIVWAFIQLCVHLFIHTCLYRVCKSLCICLLNSQCGMCALEFEFDELFLQWMFPQCQCFVAGHLEVVAWSINLFFLATWLFHFHVAMEHGWPESLMILYHNASSNWIIYFNLPMTIGKCGIINLISQWNWWRRVWAGGPNIIALPARRPGRRSCPSAMGIRNPRKQCHGWSRTTQWHSTNQCGCAVWRFPVSHRNSKALAIPLSKMSWFNRIWATSLKHWQCGLA